MVLLACSSGRQRRQHPLFPLISFAVGSAALEALAATRRVGGIPTPRPRARGSEFCGVCSEGGGKEDGEEEDGGGGGIAGGVGICETDALFLVAR